MNKGELIARIAENADITRKEATDALEAFTDAVAKTLKNDDKITLVGFGTFSKTERAARQGRNPRTGETITIDAKKTVRFKAGKELNEKI
ncbi:MAG: HU family DNA-binding protein [Chitinophagaceae bacterium]